MTLYEKAPRLRQGALSVNEACFSSRSAFNGLPVETFPVGPEFRCLFPC